MLESLFSTDHSPYGFSTPPLAFKLSEEKALSLPSSYESQPTWRLLSHHIRRYPLDLRAQVRRILIANEQPLGDYLEGSLLDLFIALGATGLGLKTRLLALTKNHLSPDAQQFFQSHLNSETPQLAYHWRSGSMLSTGLGVAPKVLVTAHRNENTTRYNSVMEEINACLEYGQIEQAQTLLEREVQAGRADDAMQQELLNIYQYTRNQTGLNTIATQLEANGVTLSPAWKQLQHEAETW